MIEKIVKKAIKKATREGKSLETIASETKVSLRTLHNWQTTNSVKACDLMNLLKVCGYDDIVKRALSRNKDIK